VGSGHGGHDPGGFSDLKPGGGDVERPCCGAAEYLGGVGCGVEGLLGDTDDGEVECECGMRAEAWPAIRVEAAEVR